MRNSSARSTAKSAADSTTKPLAGSTTNPAVDSTTNPAADSTTNPAADGSSEPRRRAAKQSIPESLSETSRRPAKRSLSGKPTGSSSGASSEVPAKPPLYDCSKCPGYCCTYPRIIIDDEDLERIAQHTKLTVAEAKRRFTRSYQDGDHEETVLRHKADVIYTSVCRFFDTTARRCTIYAVRPEVCRDYPHGRRCGYYTFLSFERKQQGNPDFVPSA